MGFWRVWLVITIVVLIHSIEPHKASRILEPEEDEGNKREVPEFKSLYRGPVPPSGPSGCTNNPGNGGPACPINEMNFAGDRSVHAVAYPKLILPFRIAGIYTSEGRH